MVGDNGLYRSNDKCGEFVVHEAGAYVHDKMLSPDLFCNILVGSPLV